MLYTVAMDLENKIESMMDNDALLKEQEEIMKTFEQSKLQEMLSGPESGEQSWQMPPEKIEAPLSPNT